MTRALSRAVAAFRWLWAAVGSALLLDQITVLWDPLRDVEIWTVLIGLLSIRVAFLGGRRPILTKEEERILRREQWDKFMEDETELDDGGG